MRRTTLVCEICGSHKEMKLSELKKRSGRYCSMTCAGVAKSRDNRRNKPKNPIKFKQTPWPVFKRGNPNDLRHKDGEVVHYI